MYELGVLDSTWHTAILSMAAAVEWRSLNWFGLPLSPSPPPPLCKYNYGGGGGGGVGVDEATAALNGHFYCGLESSSV